jgi:hypothetical protein
VPLIENATPVVDGTRIVQAGRADDVRVPAGAPRVNLAGKTIMPMLIDTHVHLSPTRELLTRDLRRRTYYGVSAALSLGADNYELLDMRGHTMPDAARFFQRRARHHDARTGPHNGASLDYDRSGRPQGVIGMKRSPRKGARPVSQNSRSLGRIFFSLIQLTPDEHGQRTKSA